ncbi:hypothetical protein PoB_005552900 [Plakobranchus ocellatus]|uniref:SMB domain-containing protein n=1 Tax=Plakobranchus ocellatus TaxID=259542 RepID=A0AAV4CE53_9GAST|nr:hypothetical protein PoB_005552900 [Plakobranchus ocellatus]
MLAPVFLPKLRDRVQALMENRHLSCILVCLCLGAQSLMAETASPDPLHSSTSSTSQLGKVVTTAVVDAITLKAKFVKGVSSSTTEGRVPWYAKSSTPDFTIKYDDQECSRLTTEFVYKENLCFAPNSEKYLIYARARYSCADRCRQMPIITKSFYECGCDEVCEVYGDCCKDMHLLCPEVYKKGKTMFAHLENAEVTCEKSQFLFLLRRWKSAGSPQTMIDTTPGQDVAIESVSDVNEQENERVPVKPRTLEQYIGFLRHFKITDTSLFVVFENYVAFKSWAAPTAAFCS